VTDLVPKIKCYLNSNLAKFGTGMFFFEIFRHHFIQHRLITLLHENFAKLKYRENVFGAK